MNTKFEITGTIEVVTGMHIGGSTAFAAIGAVDSPIIRDVISNMPLIPGTSLKGKLRSLLAKQYNTVQSSSFDDDAENILRLFGSAKKNKIKASRLIFSDSILSNINEIKSYGLNSATEVKFENSINRVTAVANPRQIERVIRGSKFPLSIIYNAEKQNEIVDDIKLLSEGFTMLQYDYLGGSGSRGYGKIKFNNLDIKVVVGNADENIIQQCKDELGKYNYDL